jgi:purine-binding chemotaxis protein CheW
MQLKEADEMLCIPGNERTYAVSLACVAEICSDIHITHIPCLPEPYVGVYNHKGTILPVLRIGEKQIENGKRQVAVLIRWHKYLFGVLTEQEPYLLSLEDAKTVEYPEGTLSESVWKEKGGLLRDGKMYAVLDVEKTAEACVICP